MNVLTQLAPYLNEASLIVLVFGLLMLYQQRQHGNERKAFTKAILTIEENSTKSYVKLAVLLARLEKSVDSHLQKHGGD